ncbi:RusA family crossover junction endodeoxyribonuclease [Clostridium perfringens]|uniref:RusA family crossover junction endodeoxyribonuclease n=1 Tax=Clostridium perfringens TaxID=1502 RepID=UPI0018D632B2|nr:RusA family crossover junction endodeoxyribonuclease [Clostridium perfringens]MBO3311654.1 RusA family crossover junction endodeoxyribonuclease [Clostridium perfringens]MBO3378452.1 RusA family crossover junction endodeoxyribonuclease [Clostridium perfringens]MCR1963664.1 RusA family crossover junction endodeoxyribonuclease [Clostridium perfringens]MDK0798457.1 RusA family crossover junction endodeoxyribonuclease [Clostridium perfringens]MDK3000883.1 RusA family crossover junction endodeoxy
MVVVTGKIRGKARPRVCRGHAFTPKDTVEYEKLVRECYKQQDGRYLEGPIKALIIAYYKIPKSYSKKRIQDIREGLEQPVKKPDADNIAKIILDSLNGVAYKDDSQIIELRVIKRYTEDNERVLFELN